VRFFQEVDADKYIRGSHPKMFRSHVNPKRDMVDLVVNLIKAVFLYAVWKKEMDVIDKGLRAGKLIG
jgi:hypothetical protein